MRCKNCGTDNDDNRYICENCGSPLYDEEDIINNDSNNEKTQAFKPVSDDKNGGNYASIEKNTDSTNPQQGSDKKSIIVIAILAVVLIAIIASVIVVAQGKKDAKTSTTNSTTTTTQQYSSTTKRKTTTKPTTTTTTTTTTPTTTEPATYNIKLVSKGGGTVDGSGTYQDGENVTIIATADEGYEFNGWYSNGNKISSTAKYSFTATENASISAVFVSVPLDEEPTEEVIE